MEAKMQVSSSSWPTAPGPQLHELVVIHMEGVERIGQEFYGQGSTKRFPALELLEFQDTPKWVEWYDIAESDFPSLREPMAMDRWYPADGGSWYPGRRWCRGRTVENSAPGS